jgi:predicted dehydrogenase
MLGVGIIGCGGISNGHARGWIANSDRAKVVAVADVAAEAAQTRAAQVGGAKIYADFHELLHDPDVDAVDICLPHHIHKAAAVAAAEAKKHILIEKPLCLDLDEAKEIEAAVEASGITLMCAHNQVFMESVQQIKPRIEDGLIGDVYWIHSADCFLSRPFIRTGSAALASHGPGTWRSKRELMGGGELIDTGYHPTYRLLYLAGSKATTVSALLTNHRLPQLDGEDTAQVMVTFENGSTGQILSSWAMNLPSGYMIHVVGDRGTLSAGPGRIEFKANGMDRPAVRELEVPDTFTREIEHFIGALEKGETPVQSLADGIATLRLIRGAYKSVDEQRIIDLDSL